MMLAAMLEKLIYIVTMAMLYVTGELQFGQCAVVGPDFILLRCSSPRSSKHRQIVLP